MTALVWPDGRAAKDHSQVSARRSLGEGLHHLKHYRRTMCQVEGRIEADRNNE
jgi:hypothetical protein